MSGLSFGFDCDDDCMYDYEEEVNNIQSQQEIDLTKIQS